MKRKLIISSLILLFLISLNNCCHAAISASSKTVNSGENVSITITSNPGVAAYKVNMTNAGGLTFISCSGGEVGGTSVTNAKSENMTTLATYNFKVPNVTTDTKYTVSFSATGMETANLDPVANSSTTATITVKAPVVTPPPTTPAPEPTTPTTPTEPTKPAEPVVSSNANLSNLGINPKEYDFTGFRASKTSYEVTVPNEVSQIEIYATAQDEKKATISGRGMKSLQEGTNVFKIIVTAENGKTKTYQLNVVRQVAGSEIVPNSGDDISDSTSESITMGLSKLELKGFKFEPEFSVDTYRYTIELEDEEIITLEQIKELIVAEVNFEGGTFEISGDEKLEKEENEVVISVKDADGREIAIYTIVFKMKKVEDTTDTAGILNNNIEDKDDETHDDKFGKEQEIIVISIIIISFIAIKSSITSYKQRKILQANGLIQEKEYYEETQEEIIENENNSEIAEKDEITEVDSNEENKDYIEDIFKTSQMSFKADDKDFIKKKRGRGKHS